MDTSETYIKVCDCEEIQGEWKCIDWDYCYCSEDEEVVVLSGYDTDNGFYGHYVQKQYQDCKVVNTSVGGCEGNHIWLPRQDQLQEMVKSNHGFPYDDSELVALFYNFVWLDSPQWDKLGILSMEQLWLAFVMKENYGKVWIGEWTTS